jgi:hypothetical protein
LSLRQLTPILSFSLLAICTTASVEASHRAKDVKAQVRFLASSWFLRSTFGQNEDQYLVEMSKSPKETPFLAHLVDKYPNEAPPLSQEVLTSKTGTTLRLRRDIECDVPFGQLALRAAPGDLMATQLVALHYQPELQVAPQANAILPCYRTVRR